MLAPASQAIAWFHTSVIPTEAQRSEAKWTTCSVAVSARTGPFDYAAFQAPLLERMKEEWTPTPV
jgi:hypothetical protein